VALQGTLDTFALPEVLTLLASTHKSGRLGVEGPAGAGSVWLADGGVVEVRADHAPRAEDPVGALFELLRLEEGSFRFEPNEASEAPGDPVDVDELLTEASTLLEEWRDITTVVPSLEHRVALRPELDADEVRVTAAQWQALVAVGSGATVRTLGEALGLAELPSARAVRELVELGVVDLDEPAATAVPEADAAVRDEDAERWTALDPRAPALADDAEREVETELAPGPWAGEALAEAPAAPESTGWFPPPPPPPAPTDLGDGLGAGRPSRFGLVADDGVSGNLAPEAAGSWLDETQGAAHPSSSHDIVGDDDLDSRIASLPSEAVAGLGLDGDQAALDARVAEFDAAVQDEDPSLSRGLLLKFLGSKG